jgi:hypothetical protein
VLGGIEPPSTPRTAEEKTDIESVLSSHSFIPAASGGAL